MNDYAVYVVFETKNIYGQHYDKPVFKTCREEELQEIYRKKMLQVIEVRLPESTAKWYAEEWNKDSEKEYQNDMKSMVDCMLN